MVTPKLRKVYQHRREFVGEPFRIRLDGSRGLRALVKDLLTQAMKRQKGTGGARYVGPVLLHLVGAKLDCTLGIGHMQHYTFPTAAAPNGRSGNFLVGDTVIHVTDLPCEALRSRCHENLVSGYRPVLVTLARRVIMAESLAEIVSEGLPVYIDLTERIDIFDVEQFIALNIYELGKFASGGRTTAIADILKRYNEIIDEVETDPSLKIVIQGRR